MLENYNSRLQLLIDWADLDLFGHVNNVAFFRYIQSARVSYCDKIGLSSLNLTPLSFMVAATQCQFKQPLTYPGEISIHTKVDWIKNSSFGLSHLITGADNNVAAEGSDVLVVFNHADKRKQYVTQELREKIAATEKRSFPVS